MELIKTYNEENLFKTQFTASGMAILVLLVLSLIGLGERVMYGLARLFAAPIGDFGYFNNPKVIIVHAIFIVGLLILTIVVNYIFGHKREKYAIALVPYFLFSIILAIQLAIQLGIYFTSHHNNLQFYLVMSLLVIISSYGIFHIQNNYKKTYDTTQANHTGLLAMFVVVFALFAVLILSFSSREVNKSISEPNIPYNVSYPDNQMLNAVPVSTEQSNYVAPGSPLDLINKAKFVPVESTEYVGVSSSNFPRIMYWYGKVNQHWDTENHAWTTDSDGVSGANVDELEYCRKFYPNTHSVVPYQPETIETWNSQGNYGSYTATLISRMCVQ